MVSLLVPPQQAWALEQDQQSKRIFESQDTMVPWRLSKRFLSEAQQAALLSGGSSTKSGGECTSAEPTAVDTTTTTTTTIAATTTTTHTVDSTADSGPCQHVTEDSGELVFQRYCHVYKEGEW